MNCPTLTKGKYAYDFGDTAHLTPLVKMHTLGSNFVPPGFHAGGLRYHGMAPLVSQCTDMGYVTPRAYDQKTCFEAGIEFARAEGILPAPEANHAVAAALDEARKCKAEGRSRAILFNLCGHGPQTLPFSQEDNLAGRRQAWPAPTTKHGRYECFALCLPFFVGALLTGSSATRSMMKLQTPARTWRSPAS